MPIGLLRMHVRDASGSKLTSEVAQGAHTERPASSRSDGTQCPPRDQLEPRRLHLAFEAGAACSGATTGTGSCDSDRSDACIPDSDVGSYGTASGYASKNTSAGGSSLSIPCSETVSFPEASHAVSAEPPPPAGASSPPELPGSPCARRFGGVPSSMLVPAASRPRARSAWDLESSDVDGGARRGSPTGKTGGLALVHSVQQGHVSALVARLGGLAAAGGDGASTAGRQPTGACANSEDLQRGSIGTRIPKPPSLAASLAPSAASAAGRAVGTASLSRIPGPPAAGQEPTRSGAFDAVSGAAPTCPMSMSPTETLARRVPSCPAGPTASLPAPRPIRSQTLPHVSQCPVSTTARPHVRSVGNGRPLYQPRRPGVSCAGSASAAALPAAAAHTRQSVRPPPSEPCTSRSAGESRSATVAGRPGTRSSLPCRGTAREVDTGQPRQAPAVACNVRLNQTSGSGAGPSSTVRQSDGRHAEDALRGTSRIPAPSAFANGPAAAPMGAARAVQANKPQACAAASKAKAKTLASKAVRPLALYGAASKGAGVRYSNSGASVYSDCAPQDPHPAESPRVRCATPPAQRLQLTPPHSPADTLPLLSSPCASPPFFSPTRPVPLQAQLSVGDFVAIASPGSDVYRMGAPSARQCGEPGDPPGADADDWQWLEAGSARRAAQCHRAGVTQLPPTVASELQPERDDNSDGDGSDGSFGLPVHAWGSVAALLSNDASLERQPPSLSLGSATYLSRSRGLAQPDEPQLRFIDNGADVMLLPLCSLTGSPGLAAVSSSPSADASRTRPMPAKQLLEPRGGDAAAGGDRATRGSRRRGLSPLIHAPSSTPNPSFGGAAEHVRRLCATPSGEQQAHGRSLLRYGDGVDESLLSLHRSTSSPEQHAPSSSVSTMPIRASAARQATSARFLARRVPTQLSRCEHPGDTDVADYACRALQYTRRRDLSPLIRAPSSTPSQSNGGAIDQAAAVELPGCRPDGRRAYRGRCCSARSEQHREPAPLHGLASPPSQSSDGEQPFSPLSVPVGEQDGATAGPPLVALSGRLADKMVKEHHRLSCLGSLRLDLSALQRATLDCGSLALHGDHEDDDHMACFSSVQFLPLPPLSVAASSEAASHRHTHSLAPMDAAGPSAQSARAQPIGPGVLLASIDGEPYLGGWNTGRYSDAGALCCFASPPSRQPSARPTARQVRGIYMPTSPPAAAAPSAARAAAQSAPSQSSPSCEQRRRRPSLEQLQGKLAQAMEELRRSSLGRSASGADPVELALVAAVHVPAAVASLDVPGAAGSNADTPRGRVERVVRASAGNGRTADGLYVAAANPLLRRGLSLPLPDNEAPVVDAWPNGVAEAQQSWIRRLPTLKPSAMPTASAQRAPETGGPAGVARHSPADMRSSELGDANAATLPPDDGCTYLPVPETSAGITPRGAHPWDRLARCAAVKAAAHAAPERLSIAEASRAGEAEVLAQDALAACRHSILSLRERCALPVAVAASVTAELQEQRQVGLAAAKEVAGAIARDAACASVAEGEAISRMEHYRRVLVAVCFAAEATDAAMSVRSYAAESAALRKLQSQRAAHRASYAHAAGCSSAAGASAAEETALAALAGQLQSTLAAFAAAAGANAREAASAAAAEDEAVNTLHERRAALASACLAAEGADAETAVRSFAAERYGLSELAARRGAQRTAYAHEAGASAALAIGASTAELAALETMLWQGRRVLAAAASAASVWAQDAVRASAASGEALSKLQRYRSAVASLSLAVEAAEAATTLRAFEAEQVGLLQLEAGRSAGRAAYAQEAAASAAVFASASAAEDAALDELCLQRQLTRSAVAAAASAAALDAVCAAQAEDAALRRRVQYRQALMGMCLAVEAADAVTADAAAAAELDALQRLEARRAAYLAAYGADAGAAAASCAPGAEDAAIGALMARRQQALATICVVASASARCTVDASAAEDDALRSLYRRRTALAAASLAAEAAGAADSLCASTAECDGLRNLAAQRDSHRAALARGAGASAHMAVDAAVAEQAAAPALAYNQDLAAAAVTRPTASVPSAWSDGEAMIAVARSSASDAVRAAAAEELALLGLQRYRSVLAGICRAVEAAEAALIVCGCVAEDMALRRLVKQRAGHRAAHAQAIALDAAAADSAAAAEESAMEALVSRRRPALLAISAAAAADAQGSVSAVASEESATCSLNHTRRVLVGECLAVEAAEAAAVARAAAAEEAALQNLYRQRSCHLAAYAHEAAACAATAGSACTAEGSALDALASGRQLELAAECAEAGAAAQDAVRAARAEDEALCRLQRYRSVVASVSFAIEAAQAATILRACHAECITLRHLHTQRMIQMAAHVREAAANDAAAARASVAEDRALHALATRRLRNLGAYAADEGGRVTTASAAADGEDRAQQELLVSLNAIMATCLVVESADAALAMRASEAEEAALQALAAARQGRLALVADTEAASAASAARAGIAQSQALVALLSERPQRLTAYALTEAASPAAAARAAACEADGVEALVVTLHRQRAATLAQVSCAFGVAARDAVAAAACEELEVQRLSAARQARLEHCAAALAAQAAAGVAASAGEEAALLALAHMLEVWRQRDAQEQLSVCATVLGSALALLAAHMQAQDAVAVPTQTEPVAVAAGASAREEAQCMRALGEEASEGVAAPTGQEADWAVREVPTAAAEPGLAVEVATGGVGQRTPQAMGQGAAHSGGGAVASGNFPRGMLNVGGRVSVKAWSLWPSRWQVTLRRSGSGSLVQVPFARESSGGVERIRNE